MSNGEGGQFLPLEQANDLYWNSERTIGGIIDELGIGRTTLYTAIRPIPAGTTCVDCGERMVFTNRTNRSAGLASCQACGMEVVVTGPSGEAAGDVGARAGGPVRDGSRGSDGWEEETSGVSAERAAIIGGAAALGIVVGAAATRAIRQRG